MSAPGGARLYHDLAAWWSLLSPPGDYVEETEDFFARLGRRGVRDGATLLELGSGGGSFAFHLKHRFRLTLTDISPAMLAVNHSVNPEGEHIVGDMRTLRLDPDSSDDTYLTDYAFLLRQADGAVRVEHDRHVEGLFSRAQWLDWMSEVGLPADGEADPWRREVFIGVHR